MDRDEVPIMFKTFPDAQEMMFDHHRNDTVFGFTRQKYYCVMKSPGPGTQPRNQWTVYTTELELVSKLGCSSRSVHVT